MNPYVQGAPSYVSLPSGGGTLTIPRPVQAASGDFLLIAIRAQGADWTADWTRPSGFTRVGPAFTPQSQGRVNGLFLKKIQDIQAEPSSYDFVSTNTVGRRIAAVLVIRDASAYVGGSANYPQYPLNTEPAVAETYSVTNGNGQPGLTIFMGAAEISGAASNIPSIVPSGFTELSTGRVPDTSSASRSYIWLGTAAHTAGAQVTAATISWPTPAGPHAESVTFQGSVAAAPLGLEGIDGEGKPVRIFYTNASAQPKTPAAMIAMRNGYSSVEDMLSRQEFYWAHRGGSASYPEHSLFAYTQAVARSYGGLEISLGRTSDGVWFGLHDEDLNRTSGLAAGALPPASSQTWDGVQVQQITIGASGAPRPYMKLLDLLEAYGKSHVLILDPKYQLAKVPELLDLLATFYGSDATAAHKVIMKGYGPSADSMVEQSNARGFKTWGYFYEAVSSVYTNAAPKWDIVGLNYDADQIYWDQLRNAVPRKRIVGHVCPTQASVDIARAKGATAFQCSGVAAITPK